MNNDDFDLLANIVYKRSGLVLSREKIYLLESRLIPICHQFNLKDMDGLVAQLRSTQQNDQTLLRAITEAMTTNETLFFRDSHPFDQLKSKVLPAFISSRSSARKLNIWCAASSSGQEPYSIAMLINNEPRLSGWNVKIVATDISNEMLTRARAGIYSQFEIQRGLPVQYIVKYFKQVQDRWQISSEIRDMVDYQEFNLLNNPSHLGVFDIVFCRNVLIYFDQPTKTQILGRIANVLSTDGILFLGGAETTLGISDRFKVVENERGMYVLS